MGTTRKANIEALQGVHCHDGFLGEETLLRLVDHENFRTTSHALVNEKLRAFRENYRDFSRNVEKLKSRKQTSKLQSLIGEWIAATAGYFGYESFEKKSLKHWEEGKVAYLAGASDSYSVAVFFSAGIDSLDSTFQDRIALTSMTGEVLSQSSRRETLCEQVEKAMNLAGFGEGVLITPNACYYFRADSQVSGQCLECRWDEMLIPDNDSALSLATYLLRSEFFSFKEETAALPADAEASDGADDETEDSGDAGSAKLTQSSELFRENLEQARQITEDLHKQVVLALELLINERLASDPTLKKEAVANKTGERIAQQLFKDGLFVLYRILFILYAEARGFLPVQNERFSSFYSLEHLRDWAEDFVRKRNRGLGNPEGTYIWGALNSMFTLLRRGVNLTGGEKVSPYNGQLFAPDRAPYFDGPHALRDEAMASVITALTRIGGKASGRRLHFANLGVEQLGAVYEALLAQKPLIVKEKSCWVPAHGSGVGFVTQAMADALDMDTFSQERGEGRARRRRATTEQLEKFIDRNRPAFTPGIGTFVIAPLGGSKRQTASFYTPPKLAEFLVKRTLKPLAHGKSSKDILAIRTIEPAMGSGGFVIQVVRYLAGQLLLAKIREKAIELRSGEKPNQKDLQRCKREIVENCIFGVDINPLAIELARTGLYLEALVPGEPLPFLHHRLKAGNSLIGSDFQNQSTSSWEEGTRFPMVFDIPFDHVAIKDKLLEAWIDVEGEATAEKCKQEAQAARTRLKQEREKIPAAVWATWANDAQQKVTAFLQLSKLAYDCFEKSQQSNAIVDELDDRYKDYLSLVPDMDPVLIEASQVTVDPLLLLKRKKALLTELGTKGYRRLVQRQRAFNRLKALGDLHAALWYWPLDKYKIYPGYSQFRELCDWLLDDRTLDPKQKPAPLNKPLIQILKTALETAKRVGAFHWQLEFASVFGDVNRMGFDALISNPPWKVVGIKDKEVFPEIDPQFMGTKPAEKAKRLAKLKYISPAASRAWFDQLKFTIDMGNHWRSGNLSPIRPDGQLDLATLFTMKSELCTTQKGRIGLIVSRAALLVNSGTRTLRERFFSDWGLEESCSFINLLGIFEIDSRVEFSLLIGEKGKKKKSVPRFVHKIIDPNSLDIVGKNLSVPDVNQVTSAPYPVEIDLATVRSLFSKESLSIPGLTDPKQLELVRAIHGNTNERVTLEDLDAFIRRGFDQKNGPKQGVSQLADNIPKKDLPSQTEIESNTIGKWVPMYRGRQFFLFDPLVSEDSADSEDASFYQYAKATEVAGLGVDLAKPSLMWRSISQPHNQRSFICTIVPQGFWSDHNVWMAQLSQFEHTLAIQSILGSLAADFLIKIAGIGYMSLTVVSTIPIPTYSSNALTEACNITRTLIAKVFSRSKVWKKLVPEKPLLDADARLVAQAKVDALIWLHYGMNLAPLDRTHLQWMLDNQFDCLNRHSPTYKTLVLKAFDEYSGQKRFCSGPTGILFKRKVVALPTTTQIPSTGEKKRNRA